jgi:cytochrome d ubiquinol oxidase subunit I
MGRQPWVVYGLLKTSDARSPLVSSGDIILSLVGYTLLYGILLLIGGRLFLREIAHGPASEPADAPRDEGSGAQHPDLVMAY